jgi:hypothetical protein
MEQVYLVNIPQGSRLKIERAGEHLAAFDAEIAPFLSGDQYEITPQTNPQTGQNQVRLSIKAPVSARAALIAADVIHNLRQALDHLVWQLALLTNPRPDIHVEFPIFISRDDGAIRKRIKDVPKLAQDLIMSVQPYHAGDGWRFHPLYYIDRLDKIDKHRMLMLLTHTLNVQLDGIDGRTINVHFANGPFSDGQIINMPPPIGQPEVHTKIYPAFAIPFEDARMREEIDASVAGLIRDGRTREQAVAADKQIVGPANQLSVTAPQHFLERIHEEVAAKIIPAFDSFFES